MNAFAVCRMLGKGTHGAVVLARRLSDQKAYAIKQINLQTIAEADKKNQLTEIRILSSIYHPNIVQLYEAFIEHNTINMVLEFCPDNDLDHEIQQHQYSRQPFEEERVWSVLVQVLLGLRELHRHGVLHRDIKGQNILCCGQVVKISDFGLAMCVEQGKLAHETLGTPYFMAPEVWRGTTYSEKCDIYSLGCLVYLMCELKYPFCGRDIGQLQWNVVNNQCAPVRSRSDDLSRLVSLMLSKNPEKRPSASDILGMPALQQRLCRCPTATGDNVLPERDEQMQHFKQCFTIGLKAQNGPSASMQQALSGHGSASICEGLYQRNNVLSRMVDFQQSRQLADQRQAFAAPKCQLERCAEAGTGETQAQRLRICPANDPAGANVPETPFLPQLHRKFTPNDSQRARNASVRAGACVGRMW